MVPGGINLALHGRTASASPIHRSRSFRNFKMNTKKMEVNPGIREDVALKAEGIYKSYKGAASAALDGIDLLVKRGEFFCLIGPNGAGKTTTISILSTLMKPDRGNVFIFGKDAVASPSKIRPLIGMVPQEIALYPMLTAKENLEYFGKMYGLKGPQLGKRVEECLEFVGLTDKAKQRISSYSGGMKRRANLAVGILNNPMLLFLDEPTVGIDAQSRRMILERLKQINLAGTTLIYTTHYIDEIEQLCTSAAIIDHGKVIVQGTKETLLNMDEGAEGLEALFFSLTGKELRD